MKQIIRKASVPKVSRQAQQMEQEAKKLQEKLEKLKGELKDIKPDPQSNQQSRWKQSSQSQRNKDQVMNTSVGNQSQVQETKQMRPLSSRSNTSVDKTVIPVSQNELIPLDEPDIEQELFDQNQHDFEQSHYEEELRRQLEDMQLFKYSNKRENNRSYVRLPSARVNIQSNTSFQQGSTQETEEKRETSFLETSNMFEQNSSQNFAVEPIATQTEHLDMEEIKDVKLVQDDKLFEEKEPTIDDVDLNFDDIKLNY